MAKKEEGWSKERIQAEMMDLKTAMRIRLSIGIIILLSGIGALASGLMFILMSILFPLGGPYYRPRLEALFSVFGPFIAIGIVLIVVSLFPLKSGVQNVADTMN
ncbi:MAG: hypothetical protein AOA66_0403 [Candidatus Bathyarchaeota archaeon BA2]|nr:MAG: hypothetical protein AOA66_0403 [Candidatus Bathyarchaeota archaeon BA2]